MSSSKRPIMVGGWSRRTGLRVGHRTITLFPLLPSRKPPLLHLHLPHPRHRGGSPLLHRQRQPSLRPSNHHQSNHLSLTRMRNQCQFSQAWDPRTALPHRGRRHISNRIQLTTLRTARVRILPWLIDLHHWRRSQNQVLPRLHRNQMCLGVVVDRRRYLESHRYPPLNDRLVPRDLCHPSQV